MRLTGSQGGMSEMVDVIGTINKITVSSALDDTIPIPIVAASQAFPSITLPNISNATILHAYLRIVGNARQSTSGASVDGAQNIQIRKDTPGTWTNALLVPNSALLHSPSSGISYISWLGAIDVSSEVDAFNDTYEVQWLNALAISDVITLQDVRVELDIYYTLDSGVEAKVDDILADTDELQANWLDPTGALFVLLSNAETYSTSAANDSADLLAITKLVEGNSVSDVGNTNTTFKTNLTETDDDYWNDHTIIINDPSLSNLIARRIIDYDGTTKFITVSVALPYTPDDLTSFSILGRVVQNTYDDATLTALVQSVKDAIQSESGAVVADGGNTPSYFKTDLSSTTLNYWTNVQILFLTGNNAGIARRISGYSVAKFITVSEAFPNTPTAAETFIIIGRVAGAGSALTESGIADATWDELKAGHTASTSFGKILQDLETVAAAIKVVTDILNGKLPTNYIMGSAVQTGKDDEIDDILADTAAMQPQVATIHGKLPSSTYLRGTADADGGLCTADKADINAQADLALSDYDPPTFTEMDAMETDLTTEIDANEAKLDILTTMVAQIQNNVYFSTTVLDMYQRPAAGSETYRIRAMVFDGSGNPEDPDSEELYMTLDGTSGSIVARTLMTKETVGIYYYDITILSTDTLENWTFTFDYLEGAVAKTHYRQSALTEWTSDINDIQTKVNAVYVKVDAVAPSPTIPAQILTHDTDIKALPNVQSTPEYLVIPSGITRINLEGGVDAVVTDIPIYDTTVLGRDGDMVCVLIGSEYVTGTIDTTNSQLTTCTRGAYSTVAAAHADLVSVYEVMIHPLRLNIFDKELNMVAPDSAPTVEIVDWQDVQEIAPTAMTAISTGLYGYDYFCVAGTQPKSRTLRFSIVINSITTLRQSTLMVLDKPASLNNLIDLVGGGTGEYLVNQDGYLDGSGVFQYWTDTMKGYLRDATTGSRLDDVLVTAYRVVNGQTILALIPPGQVTGNVNGEYEMRLDAGIYVFKFYKDQYRFPTDEVQRTVTA